MSERPYKPNLLARAVAAHLTDEDSAITRTLGPGVRAFYSARDRADAEIMFCRCDSAPKEKGPKDRGR